MIKLLLYKWFGVSTPPCETCEVLRDQLEIQQRQNADLLERLLTPPSEPHAVPAAEELRPITPQYVPWRVKQQILEAEDRKAAQLLAQKRKEMMTVGEKGHLEEIEKLEEELGVSEGVK